MSRNGKVSTAGGALHVVHKGIPETVTTKKREGTGLNTVIFKVPFHPLPQPILGFCKMRIFPSCREKDERERQCSDAEAEGNQGQTQIS